MAYSKPFKIFNFHPVYIQQILEHILNPPINSCNSLVYDLLQFTHMSIYLYVWLLSSLGMLFSFHGKLKFKKVEVTRPWSHSWYTAAMQIQTSWLLVRCFLFFFFFFSALKLSTLSTCLGKKTSDLGCDFLTPTFDN